MDFLQLCNMVERLETISYIGKVDKVVGVGVEASGTKATIGDVCLIDTGGAEPISAEVVGFRQDKLLLMPYEGVGGIGAGNFVRNTKQKLKVPVGDFLQGRIIDALGNPIDGEEPFTEPNYYFVDSSYINPFARPAINERLEFGVKAIDSLLTIGKGQRIGIFAGSGVGKSTLMGMVAKHVQADVNVIALVGERGREVREFVERDLGPEGLARSVVVVATSDQPAMLRLKCPQVATRIAEYFRDSGKNVLLMMDSLTRFAMAQREVGLAIGEPPIARGYTPSIYAEMPKLLERSGNFERGSITGVYTVLVEGDDTNEPISDTVRGIVDGHIVLSRNLAARNHFPAIDIGGSISRLMNAIVEDEHNQLASRMRDLLSVYQQNYDLVSIGAYQAGNNKRLDEALGKIDQINEFLKQGTEEVFSYEACLEMMEEILR